MTITAGSLPGIGPQENDSGWEARRRGGWRRRSAAHRQRLVPRDPRQNLASSHSALRWSSVCRSRRSTRRYTVIRQRHRKVVIAPEEMPSACDPESGQLWTAGNVTSLISEIISRSSAYRKHHLYGRNPVP